MADEAARTTFTVAEADEPEARPTRAQFEDLMSSGALRIDEDGGMARATIRPHPSGHVFRVAVGVTGRSVAEDWNAFEPPAAIPPPDAERVEGQQGAAEQRVQELEYRHLLRDTVSQEVRAVFLLESSPPHLWDAPANAVGIQLLRADQLEESLSALLSSAD